MDPVITSAGIAAGAKIVGQSIDVIRDRINVARQKGETEEAIQAYESIINDLINNKLELTQVVQQYEEELIVQKISDEDTEYISQKLLPIVEQLIGKYAGEDEEKYKETVDILKPVLSKEILNIAQLLGFNFKKAVGEPLTELASNAISSQLNNSIEYRKLLEQRQIEFFKMVNDQESYERYMSLQKGL